MDRTENIIKAAVSNSLPKKAQELSKVMNDIASAVGKAIYPINDATAPFVISALEAYIDILEEDYPSAKKASKIITKIIDDSGSKVIFKMKK